MKEIWKDIYFKENGKTIDYKGLYQISNLGRIKSLKRKNLIVEKYLNITIFRQKNFYQNFIEY